MILFRSIKADLYKLRHSSVLWIHLLIPLCGAVIFLAYYSFSPWKTSEKIAAYFEVIAIAFPLLISVICSIIVSQEEQAGNFQQLLVGTERKIIALLSKLILLMFGAVVSIFIALTVFRLGFQYGLKQRNFSINVYVQAGVGLFLGNAVLYILHVFFSLRYGKGISISIGIVGSLISAIMLTGLGDNIWHFIPWSWAARCCDYIVLNQTTSVINEIVKVDFKNAIMMMVMITFIALASILFWFSYWEGRKALE